MNHSLEQLRNWLDALEGEYFEFKKAKNNFSFDELAKYCCAMANEGGGKVILGVTDKRPRKIVGSGAFPQIERTRSGLREKIPLNIQTHIITAPEGRVLIFDVPSRPVGVPMQVEGKYWERRADSLVPMSSDRLREIFAEAGHDFSAEICHDLSMQDLDADAIEDFRRRWIKKSGNQNLGVLPKEQLLRDAELLGNNGVTYAALILFGTSQALGRFLAQAEVVFEYRSSGASGPAQKRSDYRQGFFLFYDALWREINLRNDLQHFQDGLFIQDIPTFEERSVREAILNAVCHRDYQFGGSVFIRQYPRQLAIESPGGFPAGITLDNVLDRQTSRNRRIAEAFQKCGLVERAGQGMNLMFENSIQQGKPRPDFTGTDKYNVVITLNGQVQDVRFLRFLEKVGRETLASFGTHDFLTLDIVHNEGRIPEHLKQSLQNLVKLGVVERIGRGNGTRYILSRRFHAELGEKGAHTRKKGLDHETNKQLLLKHIKESMPGGSRMAEFIQVLPALSRNQVKKLLKELKVESKIVVGGLTKAAKWYSLPHPERAEEESKTQKNQIEDPIPD